jgi:hypothetical protein
MTARDRVVLTDTTSRFALELWNASCLKTLTAVRLEARFIGRQKEKWMDLCDLAADEQDPNKLMALVTEIDRLLEVKQLRLDNASRPEFLPPLESESK